MKDTELSAELQALLPDFIGESREYVEDAEKALEAIKTDPTNTESQKALFRLFHTIKGTCSFFNLTRLEKLVHAAENVISAAQKQTDGFSPLLQTIMKDTVDRVRFLIDMLEYPNLSGPKDDQDLISRFNTVLAPEALPAVTESQNAPKTSETPQEALTSQKSKKKSSPLSSPDERFPRSPMVHIPEYMLDQFMALSSELIPTYNQIESWARDSKSTFLHNVARRLSLTINELHDSVLQARLQPIRIGWHDLPQKISTLATELHKKIVLDIEDHNLKLDRHIIEMLKAPLTHIIRNALDHGIELPEERLKVHKPECGTLRLSVNQEGAFIILTIYDDGQGLNIQRIRKKAAESLLYDKKTLDSMSDEAVSLLLFTPGFSTAPTLTKISGRGVGLDTARNYITALGGNITLSSEPGKSTTVTIIVPLTFAATKMLMVRVRDFVFALPQNGIRELLLLPQNFHEKKDVEPKITWVNDHPFVRWEGDFVPIISLAPFLKLSNTPRKNWESVTLIVIAPPGYVPFCLLVDQALHTEEVLIKALPKFLRLPPVFSGQSLLGNGTPILVLDTLTIAQLSSIRNIPKYLGHELKPQKPPQTQPLLGIYLKGKKGPEPKLLPLAYVLKIDTFVPLKIQWVNGHPFIPYHGYPLPLVELKDYPLTTADKDQLPLILMADGTRIGALPAYKVHGLVSPDSPQTEGNMTQVISGNRIWDFLDPKSLLQALPDSGVSIEALGFSLPIHEKD